MKNKELNLHTLYTKHNRESWSGFGGHLSIAVSEEEAKAVEGLNDYLSVEEVETIYIPLVRLLHLHVKSAAERNKHVNGFLKHPSFGQNSVYYRHRRQCGSRKKHDGADIAEAAFAFAGSP